MKKVLFLCLFLSIAALAVFINFEPVVSDAATQATTTVTLTVTSDMSLSGCSNAAFGNNLDITYNSAVATTTCNVNSNTGYRLEVKATTSPAMVSGSNFIDDYATTSRTAWTTNSSEKKFGFTVFGTDATGNGSWGTHTNCGRGGSATTVTNTSALYAGFKTVSTTTASRTMATPGPVDTTICYGVAKHTSASVQSGNYAAGIVFTAVVN